MKTAKSPQPNGEYAVGTFTYTVDSKRVEVMNPSMNRKVACRVYYPVTKDSVKGLKKATALSRNMVKGLRLAFKAPINYDKMTNSGENYSEAYENAPQISGMKFPLIVFNHGYNSYREGNSFLLVELASRGYVVISVAHSTEGVCTEFNDGSVVFYDSSITFKTYSPFIGGVLGALKLTKMKGTNQELSDKFDLFQDKYCNFLKGRVSEWKKDIEEALDYAKKNLSDLIDFDMGIGTSGHSFGGDLSYALCTSEPEFVCGINIDGALFGDYKNTVLDKPFMQISCKDNENVVTRTYLKHSKSVHKVLFRDMKHVGFSDMKFKLPIKSMVGKLEPELMHENLCKSHIEFFDSYLKGKKSFELDSNDVISVTTFEPDM